MQRSFVDQLLRKAADTKSSSNTDLTNYASTSLVHHVRGAVITPLHNDELAKGWLLEKNDTILDSVLLGISQSELQSLAEWYNHDEDWYNAAHTFHILGMKSHGMEMAAKKASLRRGIAAIVKVPEHEGSANLECLMRKRILNWADADTQEEADECLDAIIALLNDHKRCSQLSSRTQGSIQTQIAESLWGIRPTKYAFMTTQIDRIRQGAEMLIDTMTTYGMMIDKLPVRSRKRIELYRNIVTPFSYYSLVNVLPDKMADLATNVLGIEGSKFIFEFNEGGGEFNAGCVARDLGSYGVSADQSGYFVEPSTQRYANMAISDEAKSRFQVTCAHAAKLGADYSLSVFFAWPLMYSTSFQQMLSCFGLHSANDVDAATDAWVPTSLSWAATRDGKTESYFRPETMALLMKVLIAVRMPDMLERGDAVELVPLVEQCRWLRDR